MTCIVTNSNFTSNLVKDTGTTNQNIMCIYPGAKNTTHLNEENICTIFEELLSLLDFRNM